MRVVRVAVAVLTALLCLVLATVFGVEASPAQRSPEQPRAQLAAVARPAVRPAPGRPRACRSGLVALTFDDGPRAGTTRRLVQTLRDLHAPATFFMVGSRVQATPYLARLVARAGFAIGNHTWDHAELTRLADPAIRHELRATARALHAAGVPASGLARPPYGALDGRVRGVLRDLHLHPVLWTIDSRDWTGGSPGQIAARVLAALVPHRANLVLQHDGVDNSPHSISAVPTIVRGARHRGYCLADLDDRGRPVRPAASAPAARARH